MPVVISDETLQEAGLSVRLAWARIPSRGCVVPGPVGVLGELPGLKASVPVVGFVPFLAFVVERRTVRRLSDVDQDSIEVTS